MTDRVLLSPSGIRISKPGVDVRNPPSFTENHLVIDWSWPKIERLHHVAHVSGASLVGLPSFTVGFPTLTHPPLAFVLLREAGTNVYRDELLYFVGLLSVMGIGYFLFTSNIEVYTTVNFVGITFRGGTSSGSIHNYDYTVLVLRYP